MSYINKEETIKQIEEIQSLFTGLYFNLIGRVLEVVKSMKSYGEVCIDRNIDPEKN